MEKIKVTVDDLLNNVDFTFDGYLPSAEAFEFFNFIRLVLGSEPENTNPIAHYFLIDTIFMSGCVSDFFKARNIDYDSLRGRTAVMCTREFSKSTLVGTFLPLYMAWKGVIPGFGKVNYGLYIGDSMRNNVKTTLNTIEKVYNESEWLNTQFESARFTDEIMELVRHPRSKSEIALYQKAINQGKKKEQVPNRSERTFAMKGVGAQTGTRGTRNALQRPQFAIFDDLVASEADANSDTILTNIDTTIESDVLNALHGGGNFSIIIGTPYNKKDPVYQRIESGGWVPVVLPICKSISMDLTKTEFRGVWEDRHSYENVMKRYKSAANDGKLRNFQQELMLRIMSEEDRLVSDNDIIYFKRSTVLLNKSKYNFYITTDFATSEKTSSDFSVISVWAYNSNGDWMLVDGILKKQTMDKNINDLFRLVSMYKPLSVGIEISGQQGGFISWIREQMITRNIYFNLARNPNSNVEGLRPNTNKMVRFNTVLPMFKTKKIWFPEDLKTTPMLIEAIEELSGVSPGGFRSKHDDFLDTVSMLMQLEPFKPSEETTYKKASGSEVWEDIMPEDAVSSKSNMVF